MTPLEEELKELKELRVQTERADEYPEITYEIDEDGDLVVGSK